MLQLARCNALPPEEIGAMRRECGERTMCHILNYIDIFERLRTSDNKTRALASLSREYSHLAGDGFGYSARTLDRRYSAYVSAGGDWRVLKPTWNNGEKRMGMGTEDYAVFVRWWVNLCAQQVREDGLKATYDNMIADVWLADEPIPGLGTRSAWWVQTYGTPAPRSRIARPGDRPRGLTYATLRRIWIKHLPRSEREMAQGGFHHAQSLHPDQLLRDVGKLRFMEYLVVDDWRPDLQVIYRDEKGELRPGWFNGIPAMDLASRCILAFGGKPRVRRESDGTNEGLTRADLQFLLLKLFERWGLPRDYPVTILCENAAAAISEADEAALLATFGGRVRIQRTGTFTHRLVGSGFTEKGGQPKDKAWLEVNFRLLGTRLATTPGSTGRYYGHNPGELAGRIAETERLLKAVDRDPVRAAELRLPILHVEDATARIHRIIEAAQYRTDHQLQGFGRITEFQRAPGLPWQPVDELAQVPEEARTAIVIHERAECPAERMVRLWLADTPQPVDPALFAHLYLRKRLLAPVNGVWRWRLPSGQDDLVFRARGNPLCSHDFEVGLGSRKLLCYLSDDDSTLHVTDDGRYLGAVLRQERVDITDREATLAGAAEIASARNADLEHLRGFLGAQEDDLRAMRAHNDRVIERQRTDRQLVASDAAARIRGTDDAIGRARARDLSSIDAGALLDETPSRPAPADDTAIPDTQDLL